MFQSLVHLSSHWFPYGVRSGERRRQENKRTERQEAEIRKPGSLSFHCAGQEDKKTRRKEDRMYGLHTQKRTRGKKDKRTGGPEDKRTRGHVERRTSWQADKRIRRQGEKRTKRQEKKRMGGKEDRCSFSFPCIDFSLGLGLGVKRRVGRDEMNWRAI